VGVSQEELEAIQEAANAGLDGQDQIIEMQSELVASNVKPKPALVSQPPPLAKPASAIQIQKEMENLTIQANRRQDKMINQHQSESFYAQNPVPVQNEVIGIGTSAPQQYEYE
jgi:outer membrane biosynthesis protein TonB